MSDSKLSLVVQFLGQDKLSGALRNIIGLGKSGDQALRGLTRQARDLKGQMKDASAAIAKGSGNVDELAAKERKLAAELARVNGQIERQKKLNAFQADTGRIAARGEKLQSAGMGNVAGGAALAAPLVLAAKGGMDFSSGMVDIQQKGNLTNAVTDRMANNLLAVSAAAHQLPEDMRAGIDTLAGLGMDARIAEKMIPNIGKVSTAYKAEVSDLSATAFANFNNLKIAVADTGRSFDIMAAGGKAGAFEMKDMARTFPSMTAQMRALGQEGTGALADLTAAAQIVRRGTGDSDAAATNLENLLAKINSKGTITAFQKNFGINLPAALKKAYAEGKTPLEAIAEITKKATGGDLSKLSFAFEDMQAQGAIRQLILDLDDYRSMRKEIASASGTVSADFAQREARDASLALKDLLASGQTLAISLGSSLLPAIVPIASGMANAAKAVASWARANPEAAKAVTTLITAFIAAKVGLGVFQFGFGSVLKTVASARSVFTTLAPVLGIARTAIMFLAQGVMRAGMMMLANPVVLAIVAIVAVIGGAAYLIYRYWDQIKAAFSTALNYISGLIDRIPGWAKLLMALNPIGLALLVWKYWDRIKLGFANGVATVKGILNTAVGWMKSAGAAMMDGLLLMINPARLGAKLLEVARAGVTAFKNFFGIKSPSRLFMAMGGHMTEGLALGVERGGARPLRSLSRLAGGMAAAGAMSLSGPALAGSGKAGPARQAAPAPITIHIHQQPGEDAGALADRVAQLLERKQRKQRLRSLADDF